jgi:putative hydrolase
MLARPDQLQVLHEVQALMSLLEGHGDVTMDRAGEGLVPGAPRFARVLRERRAEARGLARFLQQLVGLEAKMRQYAEGEQFVEHVERVGGRHLLERVWHSAAMLPTLEEIREPDRWIRRAGGAALSSA